MAALALSALEAVRPYYFLQDDNRDDFLPLFVHDWRALRHGTLALFNFHQFLGIPHLAAGQTGVLYPPIYAALALSRLAFGHFFAAIDILVIAELAAGAAGAFLLLRRLGAGREASLFGALSWGLCPFTVLVSAFWSTVAPAAMLLPWMLLFSLRVLEDGRPSDLARLVAARTLLFFAGYPEYFVYAVLFEAAFALAAGGRRRTARWLASFPLTALLASPLLLPMLFEVRWSAERGGPISFRLFSFEHARAAHWLLGLVWPFADGAARYDAPRAHVGWLGLALAAGGIVEAARARSPRWGRAALALGAGALLWGCGALDRALYLLPLLDRFRFHFKLLFFSQFCLVLLASLGFSRLRLGARAAALVCALQAANLAAVALRAAPGGYVIDSQRPPLSEPFADLLGEGRIASLGRRAAAPSAYSRTLGFDYATLWGVFHLAGYDPLVPAGNFEAAYQVNEDALFDDEVARPNFAGHLRLWGVRRLVVPLEDLARYEPVLRWAGVRELARDRQRAVLDLPGARALAYWSDVPRHAVPATFDVNSARVAAESASGGTLVLNVFRQPGFAASIDGRDAPVESTPEKQLAVRVPAGRHEVVFSFEEPALNLGLALAAATILAFALWASRPAVRRVR